MGLIAREKVFEKMSEGLHNVIITSVEDLGPQEGIYGTQESARIFFTAQDQVDKQGDPVDVPMTVTTEGLGPKSNLRKLIDALGLPVVGDPPTFDLNTLVGKKCQVVIEHKDSKTTGKPYAKIVTVLKNRRPAEEV